MNPARPCRHYQLFITSPKWGHGRPKRGPIFLKAERMDSKQCTICQQVKALSEFNSRPDRPNGYRSECKQCQYARQYLRERQNRDKVNAKHAARIATQSGKLERPMFCQICGHVKRLERHHPNYNKRLQIVWVCRKCHSLITKGKIAC